jgi:hypothetical protein
MVLATTAEARIESGWQSRAYGQKEASPVIAAVSEGAVPVHMGAVLYISGSRSAQSPGMLLMEILLKMGMQEARSGLVKKPV